MIDAPFTLEQEARVREIVATALADDRAARVRSREDEQLSDELLFLGHLQRLDSDLRLFSRHQFMALRARRQLVLAQLLIEGERGAIDPVNTQSRGPAS